jgi:chemotaxis protein MotB
MRRKRRHERRPPHDRWLVSYADFITLLFAFFVVMYSAAQLDKRRAGQLATAIQTAFLQHGSLPDKPSDVGGLSESETASNLSVGETDEFKLLKGQIESALAGEISAGDVAVQESGEGLVVSLREIGFFDSGSDEIKASSAGAFARLADILRQTDREIRIEGHTDNVPIHNARFSSNWDLSAARATATVRLLIQSYSLRPELLGASGYAKYRPVASNDSPAGRTANRRVDIVIPRKH